MRQKISSELTNTGFLSFVLLLKKKFNDNTNNKKSVFVNSDEIFCRIQKKMLLFIVTY